MKAVVISILFLFFGMWAQAALPPQFSECLSDLSSTNMSAADVKEIAKVSRVTYCQNQVSLVGKVETQDLLTNPNIQIGISVAKTAYSYTDFLDMARSGKYVLYVDGSRISRDNLISLSQAGVQLVVLASSSGLSKADLLQMASAKSFILNVNATTTQADLRDYLTAGIQLVIRTSQVGLSGAAIGEVAALNSALVTIMP
ncbi:hypothetical protein AZI86_08580 [Bdellovibrio bacteriovorus]|uniref:Uncharacterized protein n=1 Tax=Bdellovibrio bacteriovorus TaxID=959 RepID=A0A150WS14_BDEBC|nr:hypothetical protein [Bdellovibrio bacteriovorus]KYG67059.1 hypothetical protein AZI86_08580 [Bdellovibrio bacteriovorus]